MRYETRGSNFRDKTPMTLARMLCLGLAGMIAAASPAAAKDCGLPPAVTPVVPDGKIASSEDIRTVSQQIQDYGFKVQTYLNCLELNKEDYFLNMNDPQRARWAEDYNALADKLTALETSLNEQIRVFNARQ